MTLNGAPSHEQFRYGIDIPILNGSTLIPRGTAIACLVSNPLANEIGSAGFFGVLVSDIPANSSGATVQHRALATISGIDEVLLNSTVIQGAPLTVDGNNRFVAAAVGQKVYGRALKPGIAGQKVQALIRLEGTL